MFVVTQQNKKRESLGALFLCQLINRNNDKHRLMKALAMPPQERLKELFDYNPETGIFTYKVRTAPRVKVGTEAGDKRKYILINVDSIKYRAHRLAWMYVTGEDPGDYQIDHYDKNPCNNRFINLRKATNAQNTRNKDKLKTNKSGYKGVVARRGGYLSKIGVDGRCVYLGDYRTAEEAHKAYCEAAYKYHEEFASYG